MVRRQTRVQKRNRRQQNKSRRNNRRQNKSLRRKRQSRRKLRGGSRYNDPRYQNPYGPYNYQKTAKDRNLEFEKERELEEAATKAGFESVKDYLDDKAHREALYAPWY